MLVVRVRGRLCAIAAGSVVETLRPLPVDGGLRGDGELIVGTSIVRGAPVPVFDLGSLFGSGEAHPSTRFVVLRVEARQVAVAVEEVLGVREIDPRLLTTLPPLLQCAEARVVESIASLDGSFLVVLRAAAIVPEETWSAIAGGAPRSEEGHPS